MIKLITLLATLQCIVCTLAAQEKCPTKFEKVSLKDFTEVYVGVDSAAAAYVIADVGHIYFEANNKQWFSTYLNVFNRKRIQNKSAFNLGTIEIPLYHNTESEEKITKIEAYTYNVVNGQIVKEKIKKEDIIIEKTSANYKVQKFTFPNVKVGSIIEYSYTLKSDFIRNLNTWYFQGNYPVLWSEYEVTIPSFFFYNTITKGYYEYASVTKRTDNNTYNVRQDVSGVLTTTRSELINVPSTDNSTKWIIKNLPAFKAERFTTTSKNYIQSIGFQQTGQQFAGGSYVGIMDDWKTASAKLLETENFGYDLYRRNGWIGSELRSDIKDEKNAVTKTIKVFKYIRDNYKCDDEDFGIFLTTNLKDVAKKKMGSIADINLLLIAMLDYVNIKATPVILSTRGHGKTFSNLPVLVDFNYVICEATIDNKKYYLDASSPTNGFNKINEICYNGFAKTISAKYNDDVILDADNLLEDKNTLIEITCNNTTKQNWVGTLKSQLGYYESTAYRNFNIKKGADELKKQILKQYTDPYEASNITFDSLAAYEAPVNVTYNFKIAIDGDNNLLFLNPLIKEGSTTNYFKSDERNYPVEMPYKTSEKITVRIEIPKGYIVDELPKPIKVKMPDDKAYFEYKILTTDGFLILNTTLNFNKANYMVDDYYDLQAFYDYVVKKHTEQIVFKKK